MTTNETKQPSQKLTKAQEIEQLKAKIAELENGATLSTYEEVKIQLDEPISVMSLIPFTLNLSTQSGGQGNLKKFTHFGEVKKILYKDLLDIIEVNRSFAESGYFYILNKEVVRQNGLEEAYSKILTKEKIDEILSTNSDECVTLYESTTPEQQEVLVRLLIDKIHANPGSINLNIVDRISRIAQVDIVKKAQDEKDLLKVLEESKEI